MHVSNAIIEQEAIKDRIYVKVHEPYSLSKDALKEEGCP
jgi:hypothetical protein